MNFDSLPVLQKGSVSIHVSNLKSILRSQGYWSGTNNQNFGVQTKAAVQYFQSTHIDKDGEFLKQDGIVGPKTWWALYNPTGSSQRSFIDQSESKGTFYGTLSSERKEMVRLALSEHKKGIREIPDGSNGGDGVDKYIEGFGRAPWCCLFISWLHKECFGNYPLDQRQAHVRTFWARAKSRGLIRSAKIYCPIPGDLMVWGFARNTGHISICVSTDETQRVINTVGGNEGNRVKLGKRIIDQESRLLGFINLFDDDTKNYKWTKKLFSSSLPENLDLSSTR